jgi:uncharacterized CHY-type Zn-finger protein
MVSQMDRDVKGPKGIEAETTVCGRCRHSGYTTEMKKYKNCPLCHSKV